jgi:type IV pilus assembly protein PilY1
MNAKKNYSSRRTIAKVLCFTLAFTQILPVAYATDIADVPMAVKNTVAPNVMFTLDDSGSMMFEIMPEDFMNQRNDITGDNCAVGLRAIYTFPRADSIYGADDYEKCTVRFNSTNKYARYFRTSAYNTLYYDPVIRYSPWVNADGTLMPNASPTAAYHNPKNTAAGTRNLTAQDTASAYWLNDNGLVVEATRTFYPATYFKYKGPGTLPSPEDGNNTEANFDLIEITPANAPFPKAAARTDCAGTTCTYDEEIQNFANWYTYYRSRILSARAGIGRAFAAQGSGMRVGFGAINYATTAVDSVSVGTVIKGVRTFSGTDRTDFFSSLYNHNIPAKGTPLRRALDDVGRYFSSTDNRGPWGQNPGSSSGTQYACRQNYNILMTDGYWNGNGANDATGNVDDTVGTAISGPNNPSFTYTPGNPYADTHSDTLADVAMYYWNRDLRSDLTNTVPTSTKDPGFWQHLVNFTVGLGVFGSVFKAAVDSAFTSNPQTIAWPNPESGTDAHKVDDLAHAAVNSRGGFFSAADPETFAQSLADALDDITDRNGAAAAVAVANANVTSGDNASYASSYNSGNWTGDLNAFPLDLTTGLPQSTSLWTSGSAQAQLDSRTAVSRKIATYTGASGAGHGVAFQPASSITWPISGTLSSLLNTPSQSDGVAVVAYSRGDRTGEANNTYRKRAHLLGDIVNAEPVVVREPMANYGDAGYASYKSSQSTRTKIVFQGANDGMLHAFNAATGAEDWAYIPNLLLGSLNSLSLKNGFSHKYYVDGTPTAGDVDFNNTAGASGSADWRTILVGGLGKGGRGYYALDVTTPTATDEAAAASKVLWEFPNSATSSTVKNNVGRSYSRPIITKTKAKGWVVIVASGYNNGGSTSGSDYTGGDGHGYLFVLNAKTGELIRALDTGVGTSADPSGLAQISGYVEDADLNNTVDIVYGGDLKGNLWRFDLRDTDSANWTVAKLATLVDGSGNFQPITAAPELGIAKAGTTFKRMVFVGTGLYLGDTDVPGSVGANSFATQTQTMYALVDDMSGSAITPLRSQLVAQTLSTPTGTPATRTLTTSQSVDLTTKRGWYIDLNMSGERITTDAALAQGVLVFASEIPNSDTCTPGGKSYLFWVDFQTGSYVSGQTVLGNYMGEALSSRPVLVKLPNGKIVALVRKSDATTSNKEIPGNPSLATVKRISWREMPEE